MSGWLFGYAILFVVIIAWLWVERWHLILPGTWPALKWLGFRRTLTGGLHGIWYGRHITSYLEFLRKTANTFGPHGRYARWLQNTYHGKVLTTDCARAIVSIEEDIPRQDLGTGIIPYSRARDIVLSAPADIVLSQCGCKQLNHIKGISCKASEAPYMTCMLIGKPLTNFHLDHNPDTTKRVSTEEALKLLESFNKAGLVHTAWFKDCLHDQFYVICNCCSCCCLGFAMQKLGIPQLVSSGYVAEVNAIACRGCEVAANCCPFDAIRIINGKSVVVWENCRGCGVCISKCPHHVRSLRLDERKGLPLDVNKLKRSSESSRINN
jgi:NAD-dependent dihydropyrimidine dehydrogenase PreA subunit